MGNNRARRAAKKRHRMQQNRRDHQRGAGPSSAPGDKGGARYDDASDEWEEESDGRSTYDGYGDDPAHIADRRVAATVGSLRVKASMADVTMAATVLRQMIAARHLGAAVDRLITRVLPLLVRGGWRPGDIAEASERVLGHDDHAVLAGFLDRLKGHAGGELLREDEIVRLGAGRDLDVRSDADLALALRLAALFTALPATDTSAGPATRPSTPSPMAGSKAGDKLAQVRALLAKAEATPYPEEAEAMSAKAQELVTRYSLELLLEETSAPDKASAAVIYRRLWLDAPYVDAKSILVNEVASANRCQAVFAPKVSLCTVVGTLFDLDAVELLVTSLLAQAQRAMLAHGSKRDAGGGSRTRSFRQSFLVSFAVHIGDRLRTTTEDSVRDADDSSVLLPAIRDREQEVRDTTEQLFPHLVSKPTNVTNGEGWAGGRAAAEVADLTVHSAVQRTTGT